MNIVKTPIKDLLVIEPTVHKDGRGYFFESYNDQKFKDQDLNFNWVQDNQSYSERGTLRGLHFQKGIHAQAKLVRVLSGKVTDVAVDLRKESPTFGETFAIELTEDNFKQLLVPRGFAHGFCVLSEFATFAYKVDNFYNKESEGGIIFSDPTLNIDWNISKEEVKLSEKDKVLPKFEEIKEDDLWS